MKALLLIGAIVAALAAARDRRRRWQGRDRRRPVRLQPLAVRARLYRREDDHERHVDPVREPVLRDERRHRRQLHEPLQRLLVLADAAAPSPLARAGGELQSRSERSTLTNQIQCGGFAQTCVTTLEAHYANGDVQFNRSDVVCTTP